MVDKAFLKKFPLFNRKETKFIFYVLKNWSSKEPRKTHSILMVKKGAEYL